MRAFMPRKKATTIVVASALLLGTAGGAYAYWSTTGSGIGSGTTAAGESGHLGFAQNTLTDMYPGDSSQNLRVTVTNNGTASAYVATIKAYVTTDKDGCTGADYLLNGNAAPSSAGTATELTWTAQDLAKGGQANATGTIQFNDRGNANQDACKGAAVTVNYLAN